MLLTLSICSCEQLFNFLSKQNVLRSVLDTNANSTYGLHFPGTPCSAQCRVWGGGGVGWLLCLLPAGDIECAASRHHRGCRGEMVSKQLASLASLAAVLASLTALASLAMLASFRTDISAYGDANQLLDYLQWWSLSSGTWSINC